jgi:nucleoside-diphosphate-sugar epimerase
VRSVVTAELHVIFGAGQVGTMLARQLLSSGNRVRIARRSAGVPQGAELVQGDAADPGFCARATAGASVVYHCFSPPYDAKVWAALLPRFMDNLIAAAARAGARLVVLDNLYMIGRPGGRPVTEDTPSRPVSQKGEIRARCADRLFEAHRRGAVRAVSGRASDYYGPGGVQTHLGERFWRPALAGQNRTAAD